MNTRFTMNAADIFLCLHPVIFDRIVDAKIDGDAVGQVMTREGHHLLRVSINDIDGSDK